jgi:diguanylate cyclase (GGDEF)-like protein/PAS domain S-box-containing protein
MNDIAHYSFRDLIDVPAFARMLDSFFLATGIPNGVVDASGELLALSAGTNACTSFHRAKSESAAYCQESNIAIMRDLRAGNIAGSLCHHGLMDYATPVVIEGRQMATLFLGQVLHTPPDMDFFRERAARFGYDEAAYLEAIASIPVVAKEHLESLMAVMVEIAQMLAASGLARLRQTRLEHDLGVQSERRIELEDILDAAPVAIGWSNEEGKIEYLNRQFIELFGYTLDDLPDLNTWYERAYPDATYRNTIIEPWQRAVEAAYLSHDPLPELESSVTCKNGAQHRVVVSLSRVGKRLLSNLTDITDRWITEQRKQAHDKMLAMVARGVALPEILNAIAQQVEFEDRASQCSIRLLDAEGKHLLPGAAPSLPLAYHEALRGIPVGQNALPCQAVTNLGQRVIVENIAAHQDAAPCRVLAQQTGLQTCWSEPIFSSRGKVLGSIAIYHAEPKQPQLEDIERLAFAANLAAIAIENRYAHDELERLAYTDHLTGLANRRRFFELAEHEVERALRYKAELSVLMMDIDHFKKINDIYGHKAGDIVLQKMAEMCRVALRSVDVVGRIGGEEFAILFPETSCKYAAEAAERLRSAFASTPIPIDDQHYLNFTVSFGVTTFSSTHNNLSALLSRADQALYQAKNSGRNRVVCMESAEPLST